MTKAELVELIGEAWRGWALGRSEGVHFITLIADRLISAGVVGEGRGDISSLVAEAQAYKWAKASGRETHDLIERLIAAIQPPPVVRDSVAEGFVLVPKEPTGEMVAAALSALSDWRKSLGADEAILRRSEPIQNGRVFMASATPEEKAVIRYRAMIAAAPPPTQAGEG